MGRWGDGEMGRFLLRVIIGSHSNKVNKIFSLFPTPNSRFPIPDSQFPVPDSRFPIPDFSFPRYNRRGKTKEILWLGKLKREYWFGLSKPS
ncbi:MULTISPECIES: hypothetical protein [unclassified Moorena]|uniref:hypothetical protein n=1 Tax=unclassified Moorena TaxID=2683338 RepID=UPI0014007C4C|nr:MULTISPECIES: hypothetical protein [unclassified Moorena]NEO14690.1 hypothetical protein [Moorena sp. SIO3E8]NEP98889.1 hypothetical protein [Moorena sp. SIO3F7]